MAESVGNSAPTPQINLVQPPRGGRRVGGLGACHRARSVAMLLWRERLRVRRQDGAGSRLSRSWASAPGGGSIYGVRGLSRYGQLRGQPLHRPATFVDLINALVR